LKSWQYSACHFQMAARVISLVLKSLQQIQKPLNLTDKNLLFQYKIKAQLEKNYEWLLDSLQTKI
jgi:hypothetical protein